MFELNIRLQTAALLFVAVILFDFFRSRKVPTTANRNFRLMIILTVVNLIIDITTVYTITHMDIIPDSVNVAVHRLLYISIAAVVESFGCYVSSLDSDKGAENHIMALLRHLPFTCAVICAFLLDVWFYTDNVSYAYSQGAAVISTFIFVGIQILLIMAETVKIRIERSNKVMIFAGVLVWIAVCVIQYFVPQLLLTGLGISVMLLFVYLSFENPAEYIDRRSGCYNRYAFDSVLREKMHSSKSFFIINTVIDELSIIIARYGYGSGHRLMNELGAFLMERSDKVYIFHDNALAFFTDSRSEAEELCRRIEARLSGTWTIKGTPIPVKSHADVLEFPDFAHNFDEINETLKYASEHVSSDKIINIIDNGCVAGYKRETAVLFALREAVKNDNFEVYYQPIYNAQKKKFTSAEALVRMKNSGNLGYISPDEFIPIAERNGLIMEIGQIVFNQVCRFIKEKALAEKGLEYIEVNISGVQITNDELPDQLSSTLEKYSIEPGFINLEITETAAVQSQQKMKINLTRIKDNGCTFSMDDFGTGYSNLSSIADASFDIIKLDKSLIWPCFDQSLSVKEQLKSRVIMCSVISMILELNIAIVAEGVETAEQAEELISRGVTFLQGYYYSKPLPAEQFCNFIGA